MATDIDSLQIHINAESQNANNALDKLIERLEKLTTSLARVDGSHFNSIANGAQNISNAVQSMGRANNVASKELEKTSNAATKTRKSFKGLASAIGTFYANFGLVIRGIKDLYGSIEGVADYLEAFNYFEVALNKVGSDWASDWEKYSKELGVNTAEEYANSFKARLNESLKGLSGVQISVDTNVETGLLTDTGMKNLGLNIQEVTKYASQLASVTNSVGQTGEVTLAVASAFTKLGADMSSLFNMDYSAVMNNLQSGLIGQSRALYKYGIDITNATLQTYAYELGVEKAVSKMTQAEKMQLRMIAILDQSRVAWGDQANTINSLSNSIRQFKNNIKEAAMILGQLFVPILSKVMPIVNGLTIAIKRLMVSIAGIFGVKLDLGDFGKSSAGIEDVSDSMEDAAGSMGAAANAAKKLKQATTALDIDELNINAPQDDKSGSTGSGSGASGGGIDLTDDILKAAEEYEKAWREAYEQMQNKAEEFANRITKAFEPVLKIIKDFAVGDFFQAGKDVSSLVASITDFFARAIDKVDWYGIGKKIGDFFAGIDWLKIFKSVANLAWQGLKAAFELAIGTFSSAPLEMSLISLVSMNKLLKSITASKLVTGLKKLKKVIEPVFDTFIAFKKGTGSNLTAGLGAIETGVISLRKNMTTLQKITTTAVAGFAEFSVISSVFEGIKTGSEGVLSGIAKIGAAASIAAAAMYTSFGPAGIAVAGVVGLIAAIKGIGDAEKQLTENSQIEKYGDTIANINNRISESAEAAKERAREAMEYVETSGIAEMNMASDLAKKYFDLYEKENLTNDEKVEMKNLASELVGIIPELSECYDEETGYINSTKNAVNDLIEAKLNEIQLEAAREKLKEAYEEQIGLYTTLQEGISLANGQQAELNRLNQEFDDLTRKMDFLTEYKELNSQLTTSCDDTDSLLKKQREIRDELTNNGTTDFPTFSSLQKKMNETQKDISSFESTYEETMSALSSSTAAYDAVGNNISVLTEMLTTGMTSAAQNGAEGFAKEFKDNKTMIESTVGQARELVDEFNGRRGIDSHSPSRKFKESGQNSIDGYVLGLTRNKHKITQEIDTITSGIISGISKVSDNMYGIGRDSMQGLYDGLSSMEGTLYRKAQSIADNIAKTIKKALDINSPSRVMFDIGNYTMQGLQNGISNVNIPEFEIGGFPEDGLFLANHNELVGGFSNGKTVVANNEQIVDGIKQGVKEAVSEMLSPYLSEIARNTRDTADKNFNIRIGDRDIGQANERYVRRSGFSFT